MGIDEGSRVETPEAQMNKQPTLTGRKVVDALI
jgi:hypothetical protein